MKVVVPGKETAAKYIIMKSENINPTFFVHFKQNVIKLCITEV